MTGIEIKRGYEILTDNRVRFGIRVINSGDSVISDVQVILDYSDSLFELEGNKIEVLGSIPPSVPRTAKFTLRPLGCVHQEEIGATVIYRDYKWEKFTIEVRPKEIHCVYPFLKEKSFTRSEFLKLSVEGYSAEQGMNFENIAPEKLFELLSQTCKNRLYKVDEFSVENGKVLYLAGESIGEKAYYLLTAIVIESEEIVQVLLRASSDKPSGLQGFLNEILENLRHLVRSVDSAKEIGFIKKEQVINIIGSVVQHTSFSGGTDPSSVTIQDSFVQRTNFRPSDDKSRKKEQEEQKKLLKQHEEAARNIEEEKRKVQEEANKKKIKKEEQERLGELKENAERKPGEKLEETKYKDTQKSRTAISTSPPPGVSKDKPKKTRKGILVFSLIFFVLLIGAASIFFALNSNSDGNQGVQPVPVNTPPENTGGETSAANDKANIVQTSSSKDFEPSFVISNQANDPNKEDMSLKISPEKVYIGDSITFAAFKKIGGDPIDGANIAIDDKALGATGPDGTTSYKADKSGTIKVSATKEGFNAINIIVTVKDLEPIFVASNLKVNPPEVDAGKNVTISANVTNTGNAAGNYTAVLLVNNTTESKDVYVDIGGNATVTFAHKSEKNPGNYTAQLQGTDQTVTYKVKASSPILLIVLLVIVVLIIGGAAYYFTKGGGDIGAIQEKVQELVSSIKLKK